MEKKEFESWIVGFTDGEGCFSISFSLREKLKYKIEVRPSFSISQNKESLIALEKIKNYFNCGGIRYSRKYRTYKYEVRCIKDIHTIIIPFFRENTLQTQKLNDFLYFSEICNLINSNHHLSKDGLIKVIEIAYKMNKSGKRKYSKEYLLSYLTS